MMVTWGDLMRGKKIAVISDIHANIHGLKSFIRYLDQEGIEMVLNLGDFAMRGPNPCEVFDLIMEDKRFINIIGDDENSLLNEERSFDELDGDGRSIYNWAKETLGEIRLEKLKELPKLKELNIQGKKILMIHDDSGYGSLGLNDESAAIRLLIRHRSIEKVDFNYITKFHYIFYGGSHLQELQFCREVYPLTIVDPGSLCCYKDNLSSFAVINFEDNEICFKIIEFDRNKLIEDLYRLNIPAKDTILCTQYNIKNAEQILESDDNLKQYATQQGHVHIFFDKLDSHGNNIVNKEVYKALIERSLKRSKYVVFGCWKYEQAIIEEILNNMKCIEVENSDTDQQWCTGELAEKVITLVKENYLNKSGRFKWFELGLIESLESERPSFGMRDYGSDCCFHNANKEDLKAIKKVLNDNDIFYRLFPNN